MTTMTEGVSVMPKTNKLSADEKRWRAEEDARTLAEARVIADDPGRLVGAKRAALRMAEEEKDRASAMNSVAKIKPNSPIRDGAKKEGAPKRKRRPRTNPNPHNVFSKI